MIRNPGNPGQGNPGQTLSPVFQSITFDALDRMVEMNNSGSYTQIIYNPQGQTFAFASNQSASYVNMRLPGGTMAVENGSGPWLYRHGDWLGSVRLVSLPSGSSRIWYDGAFGPYGENYAEQGEIDRTFTGQGQAVVNSGSYPLYDFLMREYHPVWGRWVSPDPAGLGAVSPENPQSWNRYAYVTNNPLALTDPTGLQGGAINDVCQWHPQSYLSPCSPFNYWGGYPGWSDSLRLLDIAFTPTAIGLAIPVNAEGGIILDPNIPQGFFFRIYGNWDMASMLGRLIWSPWYSVLGTLEGRGLAGELALNTRTSYGLNPQTDEFVALPDSTLAGQCARVFNPKNSVSAVVPVGDVGPYNGGGTSADMSEFNDPYWSPGGGPRQWRFPGARNIDRSEPAREDSWSVCCWNWH